MTAVSVETADRLNHIRAQLQALGVQAQAATAMEKLAKVLAVVGDPDLVVDALLLRKRPSWLWEIVGYDLSLPLTRSVAAAPANPLDGRGAE